MASRRDFYCLLFMGAAVVAFSHATACSPSTSSDGGAGGTACGDDCFGPPFCPNSGVGEGEPCNPNTDGPTCTSDDGKSDCTCTGTAWKCSALTASGGAAGAGGAGGHSSTGGAGGAGGASGSGSGGAKGTGGGA